MKPQQALEVVEAIVTLDNWDKQQLGQRIAKNLGFVPGPRGADGGVDGSVVYKGRMIHFQSKLSASKLGKDEAGIYLSDIKANGFDVSVIVAGVGYTQGFVTRIAVLRRQLKRPCTVYMLTLFDLLQDTDKLLELEDVLPNVSEILSEF